MYMEKLSIIYFVHLETKVARVNQAQFLIMMKMRSLLSKVVCSIMMSGFKLITTMSRFSGETCLNAYSRKQASIAWNVTTTTKH